MQVIAKLHNQIILIVLVWLSWNFKNRVPLVCFINLWRKLAKIYVFSPAWEWMNQGGFRNTSCVTQILSTSNLMCTSAIDICNISSESCWWRDFIQIIYSCFLFLNKKQMKSRGTGTGVKQRGEWPSGPTSSISLTEVKHGCVRSETGWATFQMNDQNSSLGRPSEGTLN